MEELFRFASAVRRAPEVDAWFAQGDALRLTVRPWFDALRACGYDVRELMHDGRPTVCAENAAFAYVDAFKVHANLGFFYGAALDDPSGLLQGKAKRTRHVKLNWGALPDRSAVEQLIVAAYEDIRERLHDQA